MQHLYAEIPGTWAGAAGPRLPAATQSRGRTNGKNMRNMQVETVLLMQHLIALGFVPDPQANTLVLIDFFIPAHPSSCSQDDDPFTLLAISSRLCYKACDI